MKSLNTSDLHLTKKVPYCRIETEEEWIKFQEDRLNEIVDIAIEKKVDFIVIAADIFDTFRVHSIIVQIFIRAFSRFKGKVIILPGNHDLLYHNVEYVNQTSYGILNAIADIENTNIIDGTKNNSYVDGLAWGKEEVVDATLNEILAMHIMCLRNKATDMFDGVTPQELLDKYPDYNLIVTGHNHDGFYYKDSAGRIVINCGSPMRQTTTELNYSPSVWIYDDELQEVERVLLSDDSNMINPDVIDNVKSIKDKKQFEKMVEEIIASASEQYDFLSMLQNYIGENKKDIGEDVYLYITRIISEIKIKEK